MDNSTNVTWQYRGIKCILYRIPEPGPERWIGYLAFGDEWVEVMDDTFENETTALDSVESEVDSMIEDLKSDDDSDELQIPDWDDPVDPNPGIDPIDPDPNPDPFPIDDKDPRPMWDSPIWLSTIEQLDSSTGETIWDRKS